MLYAHIILLSDKGRQPLSHRVTIESLDYYIKNKEQYREKAILQLCKSRALKPQHLQLYGYNRITVRFEEKGEV